MRGLSIRTQNNKKDWYLKMTKTNNNKKYNGCGGCSGSCSHVDTAKTAYSNVDGAQSACEKTELDYGFYSNILKKPFERLEDLKKAEEVYYAEQKAKEDKATQRKADAQKVEDAFKALNAARKTYKETLSQLTKEYAEALDSLKQAYDLGKKDITGKLAEAEDTYSKALKEFTDKYDQYHLSLKDGDFETTISGSTSKTDSKVQTPKTSDVFDLFDWIFRV